MWKKGVTDWAPAGGKYRGGTNSEGTVVTRNTDRLEMLAHDLASRYGEEDCIVRDILPIIAAKDAPQGHRHSVWRATQRHTFKHARLAKLGIGKPG
jgi:hypothetical protein